MVYCFELKLENQDCWFLVPSQSALCCVTMDRFLNFLCSIFCLLFSISYTQSNFELVKAVFWNSLS